MPQPQHMVVLSPNNKLKPFRSPCTRMRICLSIVLVEVKSSDETSVGGKRHAVNSSMVYLNDPSLSCHTHVVQLEKCVVSTCREGWFLRTSRDVSSQNASIVSKVTTPSMLRLTPRTQFLAVFKARTCKSRPNRFSRRNQKPSDRRDQCASANPIWMRYQFIEFANAHSQRKRLD